MEKVTKLASELWEKFAYGGAHTLQDIIYALSGYEINELLALTLFLGGGACFIIVLLLKLRQPKTHRYLIETSRNYHRS